MANARYKKWLRQENLNLIEGWKRNGLTDDQIAHNMGIAPRTLAYWKRDHVQILQALKIGRESANMLVERELFRKAASGNTTAMIFWLKNNWRDKYNDSELSPEERKLALARMEKLKADTEISKQKVTAYKNDNNLTKIVFTDDLTPDKEDTTQEGDDNDGT